MSLIYARLRELHSSLSSAVNREGSVTVSDGSLLLHDSRQLGLAAPLFSFYPVCVC